MKIEGKDYKVEFDGKGTLTMSGKLSAMPHIYEEMERFFEKVLHTVSESANAETGEKKIILDLRELIFLNSSGLKAVCVSFVMEADEYEGIHLKILCRNSLTWQVDAIPTFTDLMDNLEIVFE